MALHHLAASITPPCFFSFPCPGLTCGDTEQRTKCASPPPPVALTLICPCSPPSWPSWLQLAAVGCNPAWRPAGHNPPLPLALLELTDDDVGQLGAVA